MSSRHPVGDNAYGSNKLEGELRRYGIELIAHFLSPPAGAFEDGAPRFSADPAWQGSTGAIVLSATAIEDREEVV
jgi:hypothetical protein